MPELIFQVRGSLEAFQFYNLSSEFVSYFRPKIVVESITVWKICQISGFAMFSST